MGCPLYEEIMKELVTICGVPHKIKYCEDSFNVDTHFGQIDYLKCEIKVNNALEGAALEETLTHEIMHGIFVHIGRNDLAQNEELVQALSNAVFQSFAIRNN